MLNVAENAAEIVTILAWALEIGLRLWAVNMSRYCISGNHKQGHPEAVDVLATGAIFFGAEVHGEFDRLRRDLDLEDDAPAVSTTG